nr:MAG TPA: hypothetical protein [Bacteriophage sp.]
MIVSLIDLVCIGNECSCWHAVDMHLDFGLFELVDSRTHNLIELFLNLCGA